MKFNNYNFSMFKSTNKLNNVYKTKIIFNNNFSFSEKNNKNSENDSNSNKSNNNDKEKNKNNEEEKDDKEKNKNNKEEKKKDNKEENYKSFFDFYIKNTFLYKILSKYDYSYNQIRFLLILIHINMSLFLYALFTSYLNSKIKKISNDEFIKKFLNNEIKSIDIFKDNSNSSFNHIIGETNNKSMLHTILLNSELFDKFISNSQSHKNPNDKIYPKIHNHGISCPDEVRNNLYIISIFLSLSIIFLIKSKFINKFNNSSFLSNNKSAAKNKDESLNNNFMNIFSGVSKTDVKDYSKKIDIKFDQVAGMVSAKKEIVEFVDFLKKPEKYTKLGAKIPKGALLVGPPGTGKTLIAKATAGEADVPFYAMSGSEFVEMFVGVGASRVRKLFEKAKENSPCIVFIDEIDAIGRSRSGSFQNDEKDSTLNQLLVEMDGFGTESNVVVLAATNFPGTLDKALTRAGRFDRKIEILLPDIKEREDMLKLYLKKIKLNNEKTIDEYAQRLATLTPGFSGADISNLVNEAAIISARHNKLDVDSSSFEQASERVIAGLETKRPVNKETKNIIAIHESGHAVVSWMLENSNPLVKVTIIPRSKGSLGFNQFMSDEKVLHSKEYMLDEICALLGGRVAEEILLESITTGASNDLQKLTRMAYAMVTKLGMSDIGLQTFQDGNYVKPYSSYYENVSYICII